MAWDIDKVLPIIKQNVVDLFPEEELIEKLKKKDKIIVKYGADPSRPDLHLGHYVCLKKLKDLQDIGFTIVFIVGDFTAMIGDPSGRSKTRPRLSEEEVKENSKTYFEQVFKVLDKEKTIVRYNSEWLAPLTAKDIIELASTYTVARMLERDDFAKRYKNNIPISIHEFLYPLFQGYDSYVVQADIEVGGTDQVFNFTVGREVQKHYGQEPQIILTVPLLEGTDGKLKMSKSYDNYIALTDTPEDMYGKVMSIPDELILKYYKLVLYYTDEALKEIESLVREDPMKAKMRLAFEITSLFHGKEGARQGEEHFVKVFRQRGLPEDLPEYKIEKPEKLVDILVNAGIVSSKSEVRRLVKQKAVKIFNKELIEDPNLMIKPEELGEEGLILKIGKRKFLKITR